MQDITGNELPTGLPPMRHIDLILGAKLPNLPYHRMNPKKHEFLQGMVDNLLQKQNVQEKSKPLYSANPLGAQKRWILENAY